MCEAKRWDKVKASRNGPSFSHVFFADNLMLFAKADHKNYEAIIEVLDNFYNLVGQKIILEKSKILFSSNVTRRRKRSICGKLGIHATTNLGRYLGFPILQQSRAGAAYNFVVEKTQNKFALWKTKLLSRARKLVLAKTTAVPIIEYYMQCQALPTKVCDAVDKIIKDFLWGSTKEKKRMHMVNWNIVTLPKDLGGLGLHFMKDRNLAILAKLCWRLASDQRAPWAQMLAAGYSTPQILDKVDQPLAQVFGLPTKRVAQYMSRV